MRVLRRSLVLVSAIFTFGLGLYAGEVKATIYACLLAGSPMHYCQSFADVSAMMSAVGSNPFYGTAAACAASCY